MLTHKQALNYLYHENPERDRFRAAVDERKVFYTDDRNGHRVDGEIQLTFTANDVADLQVTSPTDDFIRALPEVVKKGFSSGSVTTTAPRLVELQNSVRSNEIGVADAKAVSFYERIVTIHFVP